jgi:co-chaperonin GroES (HSP10)
MKGTKMQVLGNRVLIRLDEPETQTKSGIILAPKQWEDAKDMGVVEEVGREVTSVKAGDRVLINPYVVHETREKNVVFVREDDVLSIL